MIRLLGVLTLVAMILADLRPTAVPGQVRSSNSSDPLSLFAKMMPVFTHPRCANCHGNTDPSLNLNHGGGQVDPGESCMDGGCHVDASDWKLASNGFVSQTAEQLCQFVSRVVLPAHPPEPVGFIRHLRDDELIKLAFVGRMGGAGGPAPPGMTHTEFLTAAQAWLDDGLGACDREGFIVHTETINTDHTYPMGPDLENRVKQSGRREVLIRFANGRYQSQVQVKGSITLTQTMRAVVNGVPCTTIITSTTDYADVDDNPGGASPPPNAGIAAEAKVEITFESNGRYTVTVRLPKEKHRQLDDAAVQDGCGAGLIPSPPETLENVWSATSFVFRGSLADPRDRTTLAGEEQRTVNVRSQVSADEDPWLFDHYAASVHLDNPSHHPVVVKTFWNIRYRP